MKRNLCIIFQFQINRDEINFYNFVCISRKLISSLSLVNFWFQDGLLPRKRKMWWKFVSLCAFKMDQCNFSCKFEWNCNFFNFKIKDSQAGNWPQTLSKVGFLKESITNPKTLWTSPSKSLYFFNCLIYFDYSKFIIGSFSELTILHKWFGAVQSFLDVVLHILVMDNFLCVIIIREISLEQELFNMVNLALNFLFSR